MALGKDLATKQDFAESRNEVSAKIADTRAELKAEIAELRATSEYILRFVVGTFLTLLSVAIKYIFFSG